MALVAPGMLTWFFSQRKVAGPTFERLTENEADSFSTAVRLEGWVLIFGAEKAVPHG